MIMKMMMLRCPLTVVVAIPGKTQAFDVYTYIYIHMIWLTIPLSDPENLEILECSNCLIVGLVSCKESSKLGKFKKLRVVHVYRFFSLGGLYYMTFKNIQ